MYRSWFRTWLVVSSAPLLWHCSGDNAARPSEKEPTIYTDAGLDAHTVDASIAPSRRDAGQGQRDAAGVVSDAAVDDEAQVDAAMQVDGAVADEPDAAVTHAVGEGTVGVGGGTLASEDMNARLVVPAGVFSTATTLTLVRVDPVPEGALLAFELGPLGTEFEQAVVLTMSYAEVDLQGVEPARLQLGLLGDHGWEPLAAAALSLFGRSLSVATQRAGVFGVIVGPPVDTEPGAAEDAGTSSDAAALYSDAGTVSELDAGLDAASR